MSRVDEIAEKYGISNVARIPIDPTFAALSDRGEIEDYKADWLDELTQKIL